MSRRGRRARALVYVLLLCAVFGTVRGAPVVLDRILVVVNGQPITRSRLELFRAYLIATNGGGLGWPKPVADVARLSPEALLDVLVTDELLFEGGSRVESLRVRDRAIAARIDRFRSGFPGPEVYQAFVERYELSPDQLRDFFIRRLRVEGYIELKVGSERPSEPELREYFRAHAASFEGRTFEEVRDRLAATLYAARAADRFDQWIAELRARANVQVPARDPEP
jgi:hypothetical protein